MKVVILAGGFGTRISEESHLKPKPMIEIGEKPILWHIMKMYSAYGFNEFVICCGYKQHVIKEWFADYYLHNSNITFDFTQENKMIVHNNVLEPWKVTIVDTGLNTMTGGRIKRVKEYLDGDTFMLTYGDGVADINIRDLLEYHRSHGKMATITAAQPGRPFRYPGYYRGRNDHQLQGEEERGRRLDQRRIHGAGTGDHGSHRRRFYSV